jgi:hypothetical protein
MSSEETAFRFVIKNQFSVRKKPVSGSEEIKFSPEEIVKKFGEKFEDV